MKKLVLALALGAASGVTVAEEVSTYEVGVGSFNMFQFPSPIRELVLPNDAPVAGDARYADGNKVVLLRFKAGADDPFQMVVMLKDETTHMIDLDPEEDAGAKKYRIGDFTTTVDRKALSNQSNPNADYLPVISEKLARLDTIPDGFFMADSQPETRMFRGESDNGEPVGIVLSPVERLEGSVEGRKVFMELFHVKSSSGVDPKNIDPSQFSEKGVGAVTVTRDAKGETFVLIVRKAG